VHVQSLASGSEGNSALLRVGETHVLIDAGLALEELEERLAAARVAPSRIDHVVLTHGHLDHARSAGALSRKTRARVHCAEAMMRNASLRGAHSFAALAVGGTRTLASALGRDPVALTTVPVPHDAHPTVALRFEAQERVFALVTDMGRPDATVARALAGAQVLFLEFNHDEELLRSGPYPEQLRRRVGGDQGHLSNLQAARMLRDLATPALHTLVLTHLSKHNNTEALARAAAERALHEAGCGQVAVLVAEQDRIGPNLSV